jgi:hypothetical protein
MITTVEVRRFILHHPTLRRILLLDFDFEFEDFVNIARNVIELSIGYNPSKLTEDGDEMGPLTLWQLECYTLVDTANKLTIEEFERMVTRYFLPCQDNRNSVQQEDQSLKTLTIGILSNEPGTASWTNSSLYQQAKEIKFERNKDMENILFIVMRW